MKHSFLITGIGGQGVITLGKILAVAGKLSGYNVIGYEHKGEAQRWGKASSLIRLFQGNESALSTRLSHGEISTVISLDLFETARQANLFSETTTVASNKIASIPPLARNTGLDVPNVDKLEKSLLSINCRMYIEDFTGMSVRYTGNAINANLMMLSWAMHKGIIFLSPNSIMEAVEIVLKSKGVGTVENAINQF